MATVHDDVHTVNGENENGGAISNSINVLNALTQEEEENDKISVFGVLLPTHVTPS